jgi:hypothetical protein
LVQVYPEFLLKPEQALLLDLADPVVLPEAAEVAHDLVHQGMVVILKLAVDELKMFMNQEMLVLMMYVLI